MSDKLTHEEFDQAVRTALGPRASSPRDTLRKVLQGQKPMTAFGEQTPFGGKNAGRA